MIRNFRDRAAEALFTGKDASATRRLGADVQAATKRKLIMLAAASAIGDLKSPPGNRLEQLRGTLSGRWSIRINDQWRIVFRWENGAATDVEIVDYH